MIKPFVDRVEKKGFETMEWKPGISRKWSRSFINIFKSKKIEKLSEPACVNNDHTIFSCSHLRFIFL